MPAVNPRITITLTPETHAVLRTLSTLTGNSQSAIVGELLNESRPVFDRMVQILQAAHKLKVAADEDRSTWIKTMDKAQAKLERQLSLALDTMDDGARPLLDAAEKVKRRAAGAGGARVRGGPTPAARAASTPMSNRGVTPWENPKKPTRSTAKAASKKGGRRGPV